MSAILTVLEHLLAASKFRSEVEERVAAAALKEAKQLAADLEARIAALEAKVGITPAAPAAPEGTPAA